MHYEIWKAREKEIVGICFDDSIKNMMYHEGNSWTDFGAVKFSEDKLKLFLPPLLGSEQKSADREPNDSAAVGSAVLGAEERGRQTQRDSFC